MFLERSVDRIGHSRSQSFEHSTVLVDNFTQPFMTRSEACELHAEPGRNAAPELEGVAQARGNHHMLMKSMVGLVDEPYVPRGGPGLHVGDVPLEPGIVFLGKVLCRPLKSGSLQYKTHGNEDLVQFLFRDIEHERTSVREVLDETFAFKLAKSLAKWSRTHSKQRA